MVTEFGDYYISEIIKDGEHDEYAYEFTNGKKKITISWKKSDKGLPAIEE